MQDKAPAGWLQGQAVTNMGDYPISAFAGPGASLRPDPAPPRFGPRARLGRYEILSAIGSGGMGEVYRALDTRLGRVVALKLLAKALMADEARRAQLESEARAVSAISHPHVCPLLDYDSDSGIPFLVMEYLAGQTLEQRLEHGSLPIEDCLRHGIQLTDALVAVHAAGIVHSDLKPANVMLTASGVKLLDFGIAALLPAADELTTSTGFDEILGTVPYMAPEQLRGEGPARAVDLYAVGAILYEMITGARPFTGASLESLMEAILTTAPPLVRSTRRDAPPALDRIIRKCLARHPAKRHDSAAALLAELRRVRVRDAHRKPAVAMQARSPILRADRRSRPGAQPPRSGISGAPGRDLRHRS